MRNPYFALFFFSISLTPLFSLTGKAEEKWTKVPLSGGDMLTMKSFPDNPHIMLCCLIEGGLYRSIDRGESWSQRMSESIYDIAVSGEGKAYIAGKEGLFKTNDFGNSWKKSMDHVTWQVMTVFDSIVVADTMSTGRTSHANREWEPWIISFDSGDTWQV